MTTLQAAVSAVTGVSWLSAAPIVATPGQAWSDGGGLHVVTSVYGSSSSFAAATVTSALAAVPAYSTSTPTSDRWEFQGRAATVSSWVPSGALAGDPTAPTASPGDADTSVATTAFVTSAVATQHTADEAEFLSQSAASATYGRLQPQAATTTLTGTLTAGQMLPVDCTAGAGAYSLPAASSVPAGAEVGAKKADTSANALVVSRAGSDLIFGTGAGATTKSLILPGEAVTFISNGSNAWTVKTSDTPSAQLEARYAPTTDRRFADVPTRIVTLLGGTEDESALSGTQTANHSTIAADTVDYAVGDRGWKVTVTGASFPTSAEIWTDYATPITWTHGAALCARVYIPDITLITSITITLYGDASHTFGTRWTRGTANVEARALANGWNTIRIPATVGTTTNWGSCYRLVVAGNATNTGATFTVGHVWIECPQKAQLLLIDDGPYRDFYNNAYLAYLKPRKIPVTLAIDPPYIGQVTGSKQRASQAEIDDMLADGISSGSIHLATNGGTTGTMTAAQIRADVAAGQKYCEQHGYTGGIWRAAWLGNSAPQAPAAKNMLVAGATYDTQTSLTTIWPPVDRYRIPRWTLDTNMSNGGVDTMFTQLQTHRCLCLAYFHAIVTPTIDQFDATDAQFAYFMAKVDAGIAAGWLECVTFEQLFARSGGRFVQGMGGGLVAHYTDETGAAVTQRLA